MYTMYNEIRIFLSASDLLQRRRPWHDIHCTDLRTRVNFEQCC